MPIKNLDAILTAGVVPGTNKAESMVGIAWLREHGAEWDRVEFNVGLGPGVQLGPGTPDYVQRSATYSTRPRADMILYRGDSTAAVVEIKERIRGSAMGQVITYAHMLQADNPRLLQVYKIVVGATIVEGIKPVFDANGVVVELLPLAIPITQA